ncbi:MAG TPA: EAL domain-containing protein [Abditibacteriaceae bacterium]|jgi:diguanylate cyclase (GGDEF)-like protein/PAS domain S-box-containing protein
MHWPFLHPTSRQTLRQLVQGLFLGAIVAGALLLLRILFAPWGNSVERNVLDIMFRLRDTRYPHPQIVVLAADDDTVRRYGRWPLPRHVYTNVVQRLHRAGAKTIAFDIVFSGLSSAPNDEQRLKDFGEACRRMGHVVQAGSYYAGTTEQYSISHSEQFGFVPQRAKAVADELPSRFAVTNKGGVSRTYPGATLPHAALRGSAAAIGHVNVRPDDDVEGTLRKVPHLVRYRGALYPSVGLAAATDFLGLKPKDIVAVPGAVRVAGREIPLDPNGDAWVNWVGGNRTFPIYTFDDLLDTKQSLQELREKFEGCLVVVGVTAAGAYEHRATPFSPNQPAVELQANAADDILSRRPLYEASSLVQRVLVFGFLMLTVVLVARRAAWGAFGVTLVLCMALSVTAVLLLAHANYYLPIATPLLGALLICGTMTGYRQLLNARELRVAEERYALAVRGANDGIWDWDLQNGSIYFSPRWKSMLGFDEDQISSDPAEWLGRVHPADVADVRAAIQAHLEGRYPHFESEYRILHQNGTYRWMLCRGLKVGHVAEQRAMPCAATASVATASGVEDAPHASNKGIASTHSVETVDFSAYGAARMAGSQTDITARKEAQEELLHNALHDRLTNLPNRVLFMERLGRSLAHSRRRHDYRFAVLFIDIDRFKVINDSLGHMVGDELLKAVSCRLISCLRPGDTAARLGGDEFTLLLDDIGDVNDATRVAERFQKELSKPFDLSGHEVAPTASIGIVIGSADQGTSQYEQPEDMLRDADTAMYRAKALGRSRHAVFDEAMHARALALLRLETDLRRALEKQNLRVYYQPIVCLKSGRISGFEALARWLHPERGLIPPGEFIGLAEETGLIIPIDQWVLREACSQIRLWQQRFPTGEGQDPLSISVNLSSKQFTQAGMVSQIQTILQETEMRPQDLKLEITESVLMENSKSAAAMLLELRELGIRLSIDDFGTGYSSLSYLHEFALDVLKIDQSFTSRMAEGENSAMVQTIITLARSMKMQVIAEGVEDERQLALLRGLACDYGQGYLFSRPLDSEAASALLARDLQW